MIMIDIIFMVCINAVGMGFLILTKPKSEPIKIEDFDYDVFYKKRD